MTTRYKYPRTMHHPMSESVSSDDKIISAEALGNLMGAEVVITEKMDGECTTIYTDSYVHARSIDSKYHPSRTWVRSLASSVGYMLPEGYRICGENLYAKHSIQYSDLSSYFLGFSVWSEDTALDWDSTISVLADVGVEHVPVLYRGTLTEDILRDIHSGIDTSTCEGFVVRSVGVITAEDFCNKVFKVVRSNHVQTDKHWMNQEVIPNACKK